MKNLIIISILIICFASCDNRTSEQRALDSYNQEKLLEMERELKIDSLVNVAYGVGEYKYMKQNRLNAIEELMSEYSDNNSLIFSFDSLKTEILKGNY